MNKKEMFKKSIIAVLSLAIVASGLLLPRASIEAKAATTLAGPQASVYVDAKDFRSGMKKVYFGGEFSVEGVNYTDRHKWIVTGTETIDDLKTAVLLCDPNTPYGTCAFGEPGKCQYEISKLDAAIKSLYGEGDGKKQFTDAEIALMKPVNISYPTYADKTKPGSPLTTINRRMYAPSARYLDEDGCPDYNTNQNILIGSGIGSIKTTVENEPIPAGSQFWLRSPYLTYVGDGGLVVGYLGVIRPLSTEFPASVVPAFNLDLTNLLFASAARYQKNSNKYTLDDYLTLRFNGTDRIGSTLQTSASGIRVNYNSSDNGKALYLVIQGNNGSDILYEKRITGSIDIPAGSIASGIDSLSPDVKAWLEYEDDADNLVYARTTDSTAPIRLHSHTWKYEAKRGKLTASIDCVAQKAEGYKYCEYKDTGRSVSLTLSVDTPVYSGSKAKVTVGTQTERAAWEKAGLKLPTLAYYKDGKKLSKAPTSLGSYIARIAVSGAKASVKYDIKLSDKQKTAIKNVKSAIDKIGTVKYSSASKKKIDAARKAYDKLNSDQRNKVTNYSILKSAEKKYKTLYDRNNVSYKTSSKKADITVPGTYNKNNYKYTVTSIKKDAFMDKYVINVTLPKTIKTIKKKAFYKDDKLRSINISSKKLTIEKGAFSGIKKANLKKVKVTVSKNMTKADFTELKNKLISEGLNKSNIVRK